jgi:hypothetical protein
MVPDSMFACRGDWYALPARIRNAIWDAYRANDLDAHAIAMADGITWYIEHPPRWATEPGGVVRRGAHRKQPLD